MEKCERSVCVITLIRGGRLKFLTAGLSTFNIRFLKIFTQVLFVWVTFTKVIFEHNIFYSSLTFDYFFTTLLVSVADIQNIKHQPCWATDTAVAAHHLKAHWKVRYAWNELGHMTCRFLNVCSASEWSCFKAGEKPAVTVLRPNSLFSSGRFITEFRNWDDPEVLIYFTDKPQNRLGFMIEKSFYVMLTFLSYCITLSHQLMFFL